MERGARPTGFPCRGQGGGGNAAGMTAGGGNDEDPDDEYEPVDVELPAAAMGAGTAPRPRSWRGMKRSLEENQQASRTATRTKIFVVWRADDKTEWGNKSNSPIVANVLTFHKARTSDTLYNERDILAYLTKQSGKELDYKRLTDKKVSSSMRPRKWRSENWWAATPSASSRMRKSWTRSEGIFPAGSCHPDSC